MVAVEAAFTAGSAVVADSTAVAGAFVGGSAAVADSAAGVAIAADLAVEATMEGLAAFTEAGVGMADSIIASPAASALDLVTGRGSIGADRIMAITDTPIIRTAGVILTIRILPATRMVMSRTATIRMLTVPI